MKIQLARICVIVALFVFLTTPVWAIEVGEPLPQFSLRTFAGESVSTSALKGKPVLVVFWNTWCAVCMHELPQIDRLVKSVGSEKLTILAINTAINDSEKKAWKYWQKKGFGFSFAFDKYFELGQAFSIRGVPTIVLADDQGVVRAKFNNLPDDIKKRIAQLSGSVP